jgi:DNA-binding NtrC family response regulator
VQQMKVLVVDDDNIVIKSCTRILESEGYAVFTVSGADEALDALGKDLFDLLLIDVKMPKRDGLFLMKEIRKSRPDLPVIVMSGYPTPETVTNAMKAGATQFIPKPFRPDELLNAIRQVFGNQATDEQ